MGTILDIEKRVEDAAAELLGSWTDLTGITGFTAVVRRFDASVAAAPPAAAVEAYAMFEDEHHIGWYRGGLRLSALTYKDDDLNRQGIRLILGALRGWAQQDDLISQLNNSTSANTAGSEVEFADLLLENPVYDATNPQHDQLLEWVLELTVIARPSNT